MITDESGYTSGFETYTSPRTQAVGLIKRYDEHPDGGGMREDELGAFVRFETVEQLSGRIAELEDVLRNFTASRDISYVEALKIARVALGDYRPHPSPEANVVGHEEEVARLKQRIADLTTERDNLSNIVASGIDEVAGAALDDAEEAIQRLTKDPARQTKAQPFAWYWHDQHGCLYITGDDRKPEVPTCAKPLYEHPPQEQMRWLPIERADKSTDRIYNFPGMPRPIANSEEYWCRDADGRVFLATWADDGKRAYWWDLEGESPVEPVEFMPHPLDPRWATTEGQP